MNVTYVKTVVQYLKSSYIGILLGLECVDDKFWS
jgi:hypothetical protein